MALLAIAACSEPAARPSPTNPPATTTSMPAATTTTVEKTIAIASYEACLAGGGLDIEPIPYDATGRPRLELVMRDVDFTDPAAVSTLTDCAGHLSTGALDLTDVPGLRTRVGELLAGFSECLRTHGVPDFPDPVPDFAGVGAPYPPTEIPYEDPDLGTAVEACRDRLG